MAICARIERASTSEVAYLRFPSDPLYHDVFGEDLQNYFRRGCNGRRHTISERYVDLGIRESKISLAFRDSAGLIVSLPEASLRLIIYHTGKITFENLPKAFSSAIPLAARAVIRVVEAQETYFKKRSALGPKP